MRRYPEYVGPIWLLAKGYTDAISAGVRRNRLALRQSWHGVPRRRACMRRSYLHRGNGANV